MSRSDVPFRPHLVLLPYPTSEEVEADTRAHDMLSIYAHVGDALHAAIRDLPSEELQIRDDLAALVTAILTGSGEASRFDRFGLLPYLSALPRVVLAMTYNYLLCDEIIRETTLIHAPSRR